MIGAGKSSTVLIDYLAELAPAQNWQVTVADVTADLALVKTKRREQTFAVSIDVSDSTSRHKLISNADVVISMLPAAMHITIAKDCILLKKHLVTPSYISEEMLRLDEEAKQTGLVFMNEMGLDPGIDHMSTMKVIDEVRERGGVVTSYQSHCGGLIAPESDTNQWHYKFTWNPRNVVLAGQGDGGIRYKKDNQLVTLNYNELFASATPLHVPGYGVFESYPNRDSLKYIEAYGLQNVATMYRGTLRIPPFCLGWNALVQAGLTRNTLIVANEVKSTFLNYWEIASDEVKHLLGSLALPDSLSSLEGMINPAEWLQKILEEKWCLQKGDIDLIVMVHQFEYVENDVLHTHQSSLVVKGKNEDHTAMALTVGLPVAIVTQMILNGEISLRGVLMPKYQQIYEPVLQQLQNHGIVFQETTSTKS